MKSPFAGLLLPLALFSLAGCSHPVDESALIAYKSFATQVHTGNFEGARAMLEYKVAPGWKPRIGGEEPPTKHFVFKSIQLDPHSATASGDSISLTTNVTVKYADKRNPAEVILVCIFGGGEWFYPDEKLPYTHHATMTRVDGVWKISDLQIVPNSGISRRTGT